MSGYAWMELGMTKLFQNEVIVRSDHSIELYYGRLCCLCRYILIYRYDKMEEMEKRMRCQS